MAQYRTVWLPNMSFDLTPSDGTSAALPSFNAKDQAYELPPRAIFGAAHLNVVSRLTGIPFTLIAFDARMHTINGIADEEQRAGRYCPEAWPVWRADQKQRRAEMVSPDSGSGQQPLADNYSIEGVGHRQHMQRRSAAHQGAFFRPYLKPDMRLLDAGCGSGSITLGLAELVSPGDVTGLDVNGEQIQAAADAANKRDLKNVSFQQGNVYELPFSDETFDAVFSNGLFEHLSKPERALREFHRVLKSPGVVGVRTSDTRGDLIDDPLLMKRQEPVIRLIKHNGGNFERGTDIMRLLRESGFVDVEAGATYESYTSMEARRRWAEMAAGMFRDSPMATQMIELGWLDSDELEQSARAWLAWAKKPNAFFTRAWVHGVGHKP